MGVDQSSLPPLTLFLCSVGDLGGQMGLFIGASILTLLEILDYIYEARNGGLAEATQTGSEGWEEGLWDKQMDGAGFLVELVWLGSQALGSLPGSP